MFDSIENLPQQLSLNDQVYDVLKNAIINHTLPKGYKLDVNLLAKKWGVSRTPVNDAIQRLMVAGLVSVVPRKGTFVAQLDVKDILELMDVRLMFEFRAAELVIKKLNKSQLKEMREILTGMDELLRSSAVDYLQYSKLDMALHELPIGWTNNQKLYQLYQAQNFQWYLSRLPRSSAGRDEHWAIFRAYEAGVVEEVKQAIQQHIEAGKKGVVTMGLMDKNKQ